MKKLYINKTNINSTSIKLMVFLILVSIFNSYSQVRVPFTPRTSNLTPAKTVYNIKGDFSMIGNTNLTLVNYNETSANNHDMEYVDIDGDLNTFNSSSATLAFSTENGAIPDCSNIIYAGLYWVGRAETQSPDNNVDGDNNPNTFQVTKNGITKNFDKQKVLIKGPNETNYTEVTAASSDIYYPSNTDNNIFTAYTEITQYVKTNGLGEYFVADIALNEGNLDGTGFSGGWGMIVVYENSKMKWRNVTIFDGHAYVAGNNSEEYTIDINGINAATSGDVNLKLGLMASEGELQWNSDYFEIEILQTNTYQKLTHSTNSINNFFNSSIITGGNTRNPNLVNNTGLDIVMFDIPNTSNNIIGNGQQNTSFRYGSNLDTYVIFNVTFSVDAYVPEPEGVLNITSVNGSTPNPPDTLEPGQSSDYILEIRNTGTEPTNNTVITIPLPDNVNPNDLNITTNTYLPFSTANIPVFNSGIGANGAIVWDLGTLPVPTDPSTVLADISFKLTVTTDCTMLSNPTFSPDVSLGGTITGVGAISNVSFSFPLIQGYITTGLCTGEPVPTPVIISIDYLSYINQPPTASNPTPINIECIADLPTPDVTVVTDEADNSGIAPIVTFVSDVSDNNSCPEVITRTYSVTDDCNNSINVTQTITIIPNTAPTVPANASSTVECLADAVQPTAPTVTDACNNDITPVITQNVDPTCEGTKIYTFTYTDCANNVSVYTYTYTIDLTTSPTVPANASSTVECLADAVQPTAPTVTDACNNDIIPVITQNTDPTCEGDKIYTFTYTDCANNVSVYTYTYTIDLLIFTLPTNGIQTVDNLADAVEPTPPAVNDNCGNPITPSAALVTATPDCQGSIVYTFAYTDCANNTANWTYTYTVELAPFTVPADASSTAECLTDATAPTPPTVLDANGDVIIPVMAQNTDPTCEGDKIYTFTYTDCAGNTADWMYTYTIDLTTSPTVPANVSSTVECLTDAVQPTAPTVTDACNNDIIPVITQNTDPTCEGTKIYTFTYTDCANNVSVYTYTYTVKDTTAPVLTLPVNVSAECSDDLTPIAFGNATAIDNCDANPVITFSDVTTDGSCPGSYTITRTWMATDACGNIATANQIISTSDTTAPEFVETDLPEDFTIECDAVPTAETLTATDNCGTATVSVVDTRTDGNCPSNYIITRTWTAIDECGLTRTHVQIITVQDTTPPTFVETLPTNIIVECDAVPDAETLTATDSCGNANVTVNDVKTNGSCPNSYSIARTWTATDECGLTTAHTQIITIQDTTRPEFVETLPSDTTVECDSVPNAETLTATDNCGDATVTLSDVKTDGDCPSNYTITRTWIATDECGLTTTHVQIITVQDTTAPTPTTSFEEIIDASCTDVPDAPALEFSDNCSTNVTVVFEETNSFDENNLVDYEIVRTWTVTDECNNTEVYTQTVNVALDEIITDVIAQDRCFDEGIVDLNTLISTTNPNGTWELIEGDTNAVLLDNIFDPTGLVLTEDFLPGSDGINYLFRYTTTEEGCISITEVTMNIHADCVVLPCGENDVVISKALTPNGDSFNESFDIMGIDLCGFTADVKIFNRWGALIYESQNYQTGENMGAWKGSAHKSSVGAAGKAPNGTYYYIINLKNSGLKPFTGPIYLGTK